MQNSIAYLIPCHTDADQCRRLIDALDVDADFFLHVDAKAPIEPFLPLGARKNVFFTSRRIRVWWGGFSLLEASLLLMSDATRRGSYARLVMLSGLDYPIKPTQTILEVLHEDPSHEYIRFFDIEETDTPVYLDLARSYYFFDAPRFLVNRYYDVRQTAQRLMKPFKRRLPRPYKHCFGHQQWAISDRCARHVLNYAEDHPDLLEFYKYAFSPEERFIHTSIANSDLCESAGGIEPYVEFGTARMANLHHIHPSLAKTYTLADFQELAASDKLFTKKITSGDSLPLIAEIDARLR